MIHKLFMGSGSGSGGPAAKSARLSLLPPGRCRRYLVAARAGDAHSLALAPSCSRSDVWLALGPRSWLCSCWRVEAPTSTFGMEFRSDGRCGQEFPTPNRRAAACDPRSNTPCCRRIDATCGGSALDCRDGIDFKRSTHIPRVFLEPPATPLPPLAYAPMRTESGLRSSRTTSKPKMPIEWRDDERCVGPYFPPSIVARPLATLPL